MNGATINGWGSADGEATINRGFKEIVSAMFIKDELYFARVHLTM